MSKEKEGVEVAEYEEFMKKRITRSEESLAGDRVSLIDKNEMENIRLDLKTEREEKTPEDFLQLMEAEIKVCREKNEDVNEKEEILQLAKNALEKMNLLRQFGNRKEDRDFEERLKRDIQDYSYWKKETEGEKNDKRIKESFRKVETIGEAIGKRVAEIRNIARSEDKISAHYGRNRNDIREKVGIKKIKVKRKIWRRLPGSKILWKKLLRKIKRTKKGIDSDLTMVNSSKDSISSTKSDLNGSRRNSKESTKSKDSDFTMNR